MKTLLKDYWLVWRMAMSARGRAGLVVLGLTGFFALCAALLVMLKKDDVLLAAGMALRVAAGGAVMGWLVYFVPGAVKLNSPLNARLVPRLRRRLVEMTALAWLCTTAFATLMSLDPRRRRRWSCC